METVQKQSNKKESEKAEEKKVLDLTLVLSKHFDDPNWQKEKKMMMIEDVITEQQKKINRQKQIERAVFRNKYRKYIAGLQNFAELSSRPCHDRGGKRCDSLKRHSSHDRVLDKRQHKRFERSQPSGHDDRQRSRSPQVCNRSLVAPTATVKVKGLPKEATEKYIHHVLAEWRPLIQVRVMKKNYTGVCQGIAFITFPSVAAAQKMMDAIGVCGLAVNGRKLSFEYCMTDDQRRENMERAKIRLQKKLQTGTFEENMEEEDEIATLGLGPIAEELEIKIQQAPSSSDSNTTSISQEDLEELMICVKKDPYLKPIVEDIETGGPIVMMRYLDDPEVFQKLAQAMGFGDLGDNSVEHNAPNADAEAQTAK